MDGVHRRHCDAIGRLQQNGMLALSTHSVAGKVEFSYFWTDLGNLVLTNFGQIDDEERRRRYEVMPRHLRRVS